MEPVESYTGLRRHLNRPKSRCWAWRCWLAAGGEHGNRSRRWFYQGCAGRIGTPRASADPLLRWENPMSRFAALIVLVLITASAQGGGTDHFLTIGGGGSPRNNQLSLERNVVFFRRTLADCGL